MTAFIRADGVTYGHGDKADANRVPLPEQQWSEIARLMDDARSRDTHWAHQQNFTASYFAGDDVAFIAREAFCKHIADNVVHRHGLHPSVVRYETEVLDFVKEILHAPESAVGTVTTGGSEGIFLAMRAARDRARARNSELIQPELVLPNTAYPVFNKAAHALDVRVVQMSESSDYRADMEGIRSAVTPNTIMIVGGAAPWPFGVVDPISELAHLADEHDIWLHVDACISGFILPFAEALGRPVTLFDFRLPSVYSISIDLHKYGYAMRGCSALILRDEELAEFQGFRSNIWPGGEYFSTTMAGSRSAGPVASAWAVMKFLGKEGYRARAAKTLASTDRLVAGLGDIAGLYVLGRPEGVHFSFSSDEIDMIAVADALMDRGWMLNIATKPTSIALMVSSQHSFDVIDHFLSDLETIAAAARKETLIRKDNASVYGIY